MTFQFKIEDSYLHFAGDGDLKKTSGRERALTGLLAAGGGPEALRRTHQTLWKGRQSSRVQKESPEPRSRAEEKGVSCLLKVRQRQSVGGIPLTVEVKFEFK